jgi:hypothetical protein
MRKIYLITLIGLGLYASEVSQLNIYGISNGKIDYKISGDMDMMGMGSVKISGKKRFIFKDNGKVSLEERVEVRKQNIMGQQQNSKNHTLNYKNGIVNYVVNFARKRIDRVVNSMAILAFGDNSKDVDEMIEENLKKIGAKKLGVGRVLGYSCDIWDTLGVKQCLYKGIPLKIESNIAGMKQVEVATKIEFGSVDDNAFKLPDFPIYDSDMKAISRGIAPKKIDKSKLQEMDKKANEQMKKDVNAISHSKSIKPPKMEFNTNANQGLSKTEEEALQNAMVAFMGGEDTLLKEAKAQMLQGAKPRVLDSLKECYRDASSLKQANRCEDRFSSYFGGEIEYFDSWSEATKRETIKEIDDYKRAIPCIKEAKSLSQLQGCMK